MSIGELLSGLFSKGDNEDSYEWESSCEGLNYYTSKQIIERINEGKAKPWIVNQHITLKMLVEQNLAESIPNGFIIPSKTIVNLDDISKSILELPPQWNNKITADIQGTTGQSTFTVKLKVKSNNNYTASFDVEGPILSLSSSKKYTLTSAQLIIFSSLDNHKHSQKTEYDNLQLMLALQSAQEAGAAIDLSHFDKLDIKAPNSISIEAELDEEGNLILTPFMGQDADHEKIEKVLGQLRSENTSTLRVGNEIILFNEEKLKAVHEILNNRKVPKEKVKEFIKNPSAFIDASLVNLDIGFSTRVHGATKFKHAYFGDTDTSGIDWFGASTSSITISPISGLVSSINDKDQLTAFAKQLEDAYQVGAVELEFNGKYFDITDKVAVSETIDKIKKKLSGEYNEPEPDDDRTDNDPDSEPDVAVVDVDLNDEDLEISSPSLDKSISEVLYPSEKLDWTNYLRTPFPHQEIGIRWILGLALNDDKSTGALLADDMGLGKTLMSLSAVDQIYRINKKEKTTQKPCLVVAPLSVLQNWKDEVKVTFSNSPFKDIVILQSDADLSNYRVGGVETKLQDVDEDSTAEIRFSLKVGDRFISDRLDMPQRLIITTYQTLRDYQFSLCTIDWGVVIFDESQNIKNPNTLQTRAAKGLKADFKLLATGTPVENSLADFWCLMDTACPGHLNTYQEFRSNYVTPILHAAGDEVEEVRGRVGRELRLAVGARMLRRVKEDHIEGLPQKNIYVGVEDDDWAFLQTLKSDMKDSQLKTYDATLTAQDESEDNMVLTGLQRLRDVSLHPQLADGGQLKVSKSNRELLSLINESGKMQSLISVLDDIKKAKEKCIIFVVNKRLQAFLSLALGQQYGLGPLSVINGDTKAVSKRSQTPTRKTIIKDFENRDGFNIIVMSPVAAGVGLTIVGANNVIHFERHWNPAKEAQATDRVYRIGQTKDVNVYVPILHHPQYESFDVNLHKLLSKKTLLKDAVVTPEQVVPKPGGFGGPIETNYRITGKHLNQISWQQFEALCADLFMKEYKSKSCHLTPINDGGADVVLMSGNSIQLIQCKHTKTAKYAGYKAIQEVSRAKQLYEKVLVKVANKLVFVTNARSITVKSKKMAKIYDVEIIQYKELNELLEKHEITYEMILERMGKKYLQVI
ncbi:MAG: SNF2-related protein [Pseudomonadota bacterium]